LRVRGRISLPSVRAFHRCGARLRCGTRWHAVSRNMPRSRAVCTPYRRCLLRAYNAAAHNAARRASSRIFQRVPLQRSIAHALAAWRWRLK
jgi:hypothetical protein